MRNNIQKPRYPGTTPFERNQQEIFFGRENDIIRLARLIKLKNIVVLNSKSGLGKSSLINAGLIPKIVKENQFIPKRIRFKAYSQLQKDEFPLEITQRMVRGGKESASTFLDRLIPGEDILWHDIKEFQIIQNDDKNLVLIFDQFEELFSYPLKYRETFQNQLAEALRPKPPQRYWTVLERFHKKGQKIFSNKEQQIFQRATNLKILIAIRSDKMHFLNQMSDYFPNILKNCFELLPLSTEQAKLAIMRPAFSLGDYDSPIFSYLPDALKTIIDYLTLHGEENIESTQLQIICSSIESKVKAQKISIVGLKDTGNLEQIINNYYEEKIASLGDVETQLAARKLIEEGLIFDEEEQRLSLYEGQILKSYNISNELLEELVKSRLLRVESSKAGDIYELSHDTLVKPVLKGKRKRLAAAARQQAKEERLAEQLAQKEILVEERKKRRRALLIALGAIAMSIFSFVSFLQAQSAKDKAVETLEKLQTTNEELSNANKAKIEATAKIDSIYVLRLIEDGRKMERVNYCDMALEKYNEAKKYAKDKGVIDNIISECEQKCRKL